MPSPSEAGGNHRLSIPIPKFNSLVIKNKSTKRQKWQVCKGHKEEPSFIKHVQFLPVTLPIPTFEFQPQI